MATADRLVTLEELYALPDDGRKHELESGLLVSEPPPSPLHGQIAARITYELERFVRPRDLGVVLASDAGFVLARDPDTLRGPDVAFVRRERWDRVEDPRRPFEGPPDLAVEVLSPGNTATAMRGKVADYLAAGASRVWVIDPDRRVVTSYASLLSPRTLAGEDELDGGDVLPGLRVRVEALFER